MPKKPQKPRQQKTAKPESKQALVGVLSKAIEQTKEKLKHESANNDLIKMLLATEKTKEGLRVGDLLIKISAVQIGSTTKNCYSIFDKFGEKICQDLWLFESALLVAKFRMFRRSRNIVSTQLVLREDSRYFHHMLDAEIFAIKLKKCKDAFRADLFEARFTQSVGKMHQSRQHIKKMV